MSIKRLPVCDHLFNRFPCQCLPAVLSASSLSLVSFFQICSTRGRRGRELVPDPRRHHHQWPRLEVPNVNLRRTKLCNLKSEKSSLDAKMMMQFFPRSSSDFMSDFSMEQVEKTKLIFEIIRSFWRQLKFSRHYVE